MGYIQTADLLHLSSLCHLLPGLAVLVRGQMLTDSTHVWACCQERVLLACLSSEFIYCYSEQSYQLTSRMPQWPGANERLGAHGNYVRGLGANSVVCLLALVANADHWLLPLGALKVVVRTTDCVVCVVLIYLFPCWQHHSLNTCQRSWYLHYELSIFLLLSIFLFCPLANWSTTGFNTYTNSNWWSVLATMVSGNTIELATTTAENSPPEQLLTNFCSLFLSQSFSAWFGP